MTIAAGRASGHVKLGTFLELTRELFAVLDDDLRVLWTNPALRNLLGYGPRDVIDAELADLCHADDRSGVAALRVAVEEGREVSGHRLRMRASDGTWRWMEWSLRAHPERHLVYGVSRDITARQASERALRESEGRLRAILRHAPAAIYIKDPEGRYQAVNPAYGELLGTSPDEITGRLDTEVWPANAEAMRRRRDRDRDRDRDETLTIEVDLNTPAGVRRFALSEFVLRNDSGEAYAIVGIAADLTERLELLRALAERRRLLRGILETSEDVISLIDGDGRTTRVSPSQATLLGREVAVLGEASLLDGVHPDDRLQVTAVFDDLVAGRTRAVRVRSRLQRADGEYVVAESIASAIPTDDGSFAGAVIVTRDLTERLAAEEQLREAMTVAEHASRLKSDFLSRMSHELRTPLNSVLGFAQLLHMDPLPPDQAQAVDHILRAGRHLLDLIDEVLDIARIETGRLQLALEPVSLAAVVDDAVAITRPLADRAGVALEVLASVASAGGVIADRQRLLQVLLNLLSNVVKYNFEGGSVEVAVEATDVGVVRFSVADNGRGIAQEHLSRLFTPFERLGAEHSGIEGSGVGLALSKHLVEGMGGHLTFESEAGAGSTFSVELPRRAADGQQIDPSSSPAASPAAADPEAPFEVLVVEDNPANLALVRGVLARRPGIEVAAAAFGRDALALAREHPPALVLLDLHLPDMPGEEVLRQLRADPATSSVPVTVVSADVGALRVRNLLSEGAHGFLAKPIDVHKLLALVDGMRAGNAP